MNQDEKYKDLKVVAEQPNATPEEKLIAEIDRDRLLGSYHLRTTWWLNLAWFAHLLALIAIAYETYLSAHPNRPAPRIGLVY